jgi:regulator of nucleoside diphosphate kinase
MSDIKHAALSATDDTILSSNDFARLEIMALDEGGTTRERILAKLDAGTVASGENIASNVATIGSVLRYRFGNGPVERRTLSLPSVARPTGQFINVVTPVGLALLGRRAGQRWAVELPEGRSIMLELLEVEFQPEAEVRRRSTWVPDDGPGAA